MVVNNWVNEFEFESFGLLKCSLQVLYLKLIFQLYCLNCASTLLHEVKDKTQSAFLSKSFTLKAYLYPLDFKFVASCFLSSGMVEMPRWCTFWGRPNHGVTLSTAKPDRFQEVCKSLQHTPASSWTGGLYIPVLWFQCCSNSMEKRSFTLDVWR